MATIQFNQSMGAGGVSASGAIQATVTTQVGVDPTLPAGQQGTLTTRSSNTAGVITLDAAAVPTVTDADLVSLFWADGHRYGMTVSLVGADTVTFTGGSGDNLPATTTVVIVAKEITIDLAGVIGNEVEMFCVSCVSNCHFHIHDNVGTGNLILIPCYLKAGQSQGWFDGSVFANPFAGLELGTLVASNGGTTAVTFNLAMGLNTTL